MIFGNLEIDFSNMNKKVEDLLNYYQNVLYLALDEL